MSKDSPAELTELRRAVRGVIEEWLESGRFSPSCDAWLRSYDLEFSKALGKHGWLGITWPQEVGGSGRGNRARLVVTEELLRAGAPVAAHWIGERQIGPAILRYGTPHLQQLYLPRIASGEVTFCLGMSETESGSDLASVRTTAVHEDGGWRVTGRKIWTSQAHRSTHAYVLARTSRGERKHEGLTEFLVDMASTGVEVRPIYDLRGEHHFNEVTFDGVLVPDDHVLGTVGNGWRQVTEQLSFERGGMERVLSTYPLLAAVVDDVQRRGDVPDDVARQVGSALSRLRTLRGMAWRVVAELDRGEAPVQQAAMLKDLGTVFERDVNELARRVLDDEADPGADGPTGLLAQGVLAAPGFTIRGGTTEVLRSIIARGAAAGSARRAGDRTDELRAVVDDVLGGKGGDPGDGVPPLWRTLHDLGWATVGIDEAKGGSGGTLADLATIAEGLGRHVTSAPLLETALAARVLAEVGSELPSGTATVVLPRRGDEVVVRGREGGRTLSGRATRVPWAAAAELLVVIATDEAGDDVAVLLPGGAAGLARSDGRNLAAEPRDTVTFDDVPVSDEQLLARAPDARTVQAIGALLGAAAIVGALENAYDSTRRHVSERQQFGRPLLSFQAVGHELAAVATHLAVARTALDDAVTAVERGDEPLTPVAAARVVAASAATEVVRVAHQLHGAMGVTREHPLHLATRRLWSWRDEWGTEQQWAALLGQHLVPRGADAVWQWLTDDTDDRREGDDA